MSFQKKIPPIRVLITKDKFNNLLEFLSSKINSLDEKLKEKAEKLKEKLLKYSIPRNDDEKELYVDIRFYPNESEDLLYILIDNLEINISEDYYEKLVCSHKN